MRTAILAALLSAGAGWAELPAHGKWSLTFVDEFVGTSLDREKWDVESGSPGHILSSRWPENVEVRDGICRLVTKKESRGGKEWTTAHFWTRSFRQKYGYFEARYRYGRAPGLNNAFWLMTRTAEENPPVRFELDINEGHVPNKVNMNVHQWAGTHWAQARKWEAPGDLSREFHVFGFEWTPSELIWYFDGQVIRRRENDIAHGEVPVIFSTAVLKWAGEITDKLDGTAMEVDRVRVYRREDKDTSLNLLSMIRPVPETAKFADDNWYIWCGAVTRGGDGKYHLYYSRWPRKLGHYAWVTHSEIAHAVGESATGAFHFSDVVLPARGKAYWDGLTTHNPTILKHAGKYFLYYMGTTGDGQAMETLNWTHRNNQRIGVAVADSPYGPWKRFDKPLVDVSADPDAPDALVANNPAVAEGPDGTFLMVYKAVAKKRPLPFGGPVVHLTAKAQSPLGPFEKQLRPIFTAPGVDFPAEDPFVWYDSAARRYRAVVKDMKGDFTRAGKSLALWESPDGLDWRPSEHALVSRTVLRWAGGRVQELNSLERPQLLFEDGRPVLLLCAVDEDPQRKHSYNVRVPLE